MHRLLDWLASLYPTAVVKFNFDTTTLNFQLNTSFAKFYLRNASYNGLIGDIASLMIKYDPKIKALDLGANVGTTVHYLRKAGVSSILAVEGYSIFAEILRRNKALHSWNEVVVVNALLAADGQKSLSLKRNKGNSWAYENSDNRIEPRSLVKIVEDNPGFKNARLWKLDIEGLESEVILSSMNLIKKAFPVLFVEIFPRICKSRGITLAPLLVELKNVGYHYAIYFNTFGLAQWAFSLYDIIDNYQLETLIDAGFGAHADVCFFHQQDANLFDELKQQKFNSAYQQIVPFQLD